MILGGSQSMLHNLLNEIHLINLAKQNILVRLHTFISPFRSQRDECNLRQHSDAIAHWDRSSLKKIFTVQHSINHSL